MEALEQATPGISLNVHASNDRDAVIDVAVGVAPTVMDARIVTRPLLRDAFVTIVSTGHPAASRLMDLRKYLDLQHVPVSPEGQLHGLVDQPSRNPAQRWFSEFIAEKSAALYSSLPLKAAAQANCYASPSACAARGAAAGVPAARDPASWSQAMAALRNI